MRSSRTTLDFIEDVKILHNNFYNYDKVIYKSAKDFVVITCPIHGDFSQRPSNHKSGNGCPKCAIAKRAKNRKVWTEDSYKNEVSKIHPHLIFDKTIYVNPTTKVLYDCKIHGQKEVHPYNLLKGCGCGQCDSSRSRVSKETWINRFKECKCKKISYENIPEHFNAHEKISFDCIIHGEFKQSPTQHLKSCCPKCGSENTGWTYTNWQKAGEKSKNFDSFKVYIIRCWNEDEEFYKIGKTFWTLYNRFKNKVAMPYNYRVIEYYAFIDSREASNTERFLQNLNKEHRYKPKINFGGDSECFSKIMYRGIS